MDMEKLVDAMTAEIYQNLLDAVATGRWADGQQLSAEQLDNAQQMLILYQARHNHSPEHFTISTEGELFFKSKQELKKQFKPDDVIFAQSLEDDLTN